VIGSVANLQLQPQPQLGWPVMRAGAGRSLPVTEQWKRNCVDSLVRDVGLSFGGKWLVQRQGNYGEVDITATGKLRCIGSSLAAILAIMTPNKPDI
jgi:hypothetical protein